MKIYLKKKYLDQQFHKLNYVPLYSLNIYSEHGITLESCISVLGKQKD